MSSDRREAIDRVFLEALQLPSDARADQVSRSCAGDEALRRDVLSLLAASERSGEFLETPAFEQLVNVIAADGWSLRPGQRLGAYVVSELLGAGAVGEVWRATDERLNRDVAIKVLLPHLAGNPERVRHFIEEARTAGSLNHPNILSVHDVGEYCGAPFIVSEYVEGESLRARLRRGPLPVDIAGAVAVQIARGLSAAHARGIVHRDLKPDNVFLRSDGGVKILDFGLATLSEAATSTADRIGESAGALAGTAGYAAPELLRGGGADVRSDLFALGVTLHEMLAGSRPFQGTGILETLRATIDAEPPDLRAVRAEVSAAIAHVVTRLLDKVPEKRFQSADDLLLALEAAAPSPRTGQRRLAVPALFGATTVLILLAIGAALMSRNRQSDSPVAPGSNGRPAVAVLSFENATGTADAAWMTTGVPSMLLTGLAQTRGLDVISAERFHAALQQEGYTSTGSLNQYQSARVARRAGAGAVVVGTIYKAETGFRIDARVEDLTAGRILAAESVSGPDVFAVADSLAARIRAAIGLGGDVDLRRITDVSSTSIAAYRLYARGLDAGVNLRWAESAKFLEQAVAIDPGFAEAHLRLANAYGGLGQSGAHDRALRNAFAHGFRLSERHRLLLAVQLEPDAGRKAQLLDQLLARFPDVEEAYPIASQLYDSAAGALPNLEKLVTITRAGVSVLPASAQVRNTHGYALLVSGRFAEAAREFEEYARLAPMEPNPFDSLGEAYVLMGQPARAAEFYSRALAIDRDFTSHDGLAYALGMVGRYQEAVAAKPTLTTIKAMILSRIGRYDEADRVIQAGIADARENENMVMAGGLQLLSASLALERSDFAATLRETRMAREAISRASERWAKNMTFVADTLAGLADLRLGRLAQAQRLAERQAATYRVSNPVDRLWHGVLRAELALTRGDTTAVTNAFSDFVRSRRGISYTVPGSVLTNNLILRDAPARAAQARGDTAEAIRIYRQLLTNAPELKWVALYEPRYVLQLARLLDRAGERQAARAEYSRFLEVWKTADADLPELAEARRALARD